MKLSLSQTKPHQWNGQTLVVGLFDGISLEQLQSRLDATAAAFILDLVENEEISLKEGKTTLLFRVPSVASQQVLVVGFGKSVDWNAGIAFRCASAATKALSGSRRSSILMTGFEGNELVLRSAVVGSLVGCVGQDLFRKEKSTLGPEAIEWHGVAQSVLNAGQQIAEAVNLTRRLVNLPANVIYPESFVDEVISVATPLGIEIEVWDRAKLESEKCGALLAVARGSSKEPRLLIMKYKGNDPGDFDTALVGKGVTFDSGGLSIKPTESMLTMKCDMAGGATVAGVMCGLAAMNSTKPIIGLIGLVENMISADCYRLGDVVTARNGKTIEIHNTDAEGRLVLADVLDVTCQYRPKRIVDFATLTGACVVALGTDIVGAMGNDPAWQSEVLGMAEECGEYVWPLPMHKFFGEQIRGKVADIKNVGEGRWAGAITAAKFLEEFVDAKPWLHLDIAGPAFYDSAKPWIDAGASGVMVRTMIELFSSAE